MNKATITFYGGAGVVTGANFLFNTGNSKILIDCGAEVSEHTCDDINTQAFAYKPADIDMLFITHAHADHIGRIPKLVHDGFRGRIISTPATRDLAAIMLADAYTVMTRHSTERGCSMMYGEDDIANALSLWDTREYHNTFELSEVVGELGLPEGSPSSPIAVTLLDAGHILGSAMIRFERAGRVIIFTGDLGNSPEPLLRDTESPEGAHYLLMESVYGDRNHEGRDDRLARFEDIIIETQKNGGTLLIPSFSLERTQILLYELEKLMKSKDLKPIDVYLDAPLAIKATEIFRQYPTDFNEEVQAVFNSGADPFSFPHLKVVKSTSESRAIHNTPGAKIIIAGAGMSSGGRIRAHEAKYLPEKNAILLFVGYQAAGSLGRRIQEGERHVTIDGVHITINARVETLSGYSGHKDRDGLLSFVEKAKPTLERVFVAMGEPKSEQFLSQRINDFLGIKAVAPQKGDMVSIDW